MKIMRAFGFITLISGALFFSVGCSELAGSGDLVPIPAVTFTCNSSNCTGTLGTNQYRVIYSNFDCTGAGDQSFYTVASATGFNLNCSGASCSGMATGWIGRNGLTITEIPEDTYTVCVVVFRQGSITGGATAGDAWAEQNGVSVSESTGTVTITAPFNNGAPTLQFNEAFTSDTEDIL